MKLQTTIRKIMIFNPKKCDLTYDPDGIRGQRETEPAAHEPVSVSATHRGTNPNGDPETTPAPTPAPTQAKLVQYARQDWAKIVQLSTKFYSAQMSGKLPIDHPVRWRFSAHEKDGRPCGLDLAGGFYDCKYRYVLGCHF